MPLPPLSSLTPKCMQLLCCTNLPIPPSHPSLTNPSTHKVEFHDLSTSQLEPGECKSLPFTRQIMGPQFIFSVKTAHTLGPYNTPQWRVYDQQFRWQQYSNEGDWASCLNRWCSCLAFRRCLLNFLSTTLVPLNEVFCGFPQSLPTITG